MNGESRRVVYEGYFRSTGGDEFIPRLWATRKIGYLLTQIRLHGANQEWVEAIVALSLRYGIITPYTSFLIQEEDILTDAGREEVERQFMALPAAPAWGAPAARRADEENKMLGAESGGGAMPEEAAQVVRLAGNKTFVLRDGVWIDTAFDPSWMSTTKVGFGGDAYFGLLTARPEWGVYFALGTHVIFVAEGVAYEVVEGEGGPVAIPPTRTPELAQPTVEPTRPGSTPTPAAASADAGGPCVGAVVMGAIALAAMAFWQRMRV